MGRTIYQRILTWIINKISRTILKAAFVAIAFVVTGKFVVSAFAMLLLVSCRLDKRRHIPDADSSGTPSAELEQSRAHGVTF